MRSFSVQEGQERTYQFIVGVGLELHVQVGSFCCWSLSWVYGDDCPVETPAFGPVTSRENSVPGHLPRHGFKRVGPPVNYKVAPVFLLPFRCTDFSGFLDSHGCWPVADSCIGVNNRTQVFSYLEPDFMRFTGSLTAHKEEGTLCRNKDIGSFFKSFVPGCRGQFSLTFHKGLPEPVGTYNFLELGVSHLTCIFSFNLSVSEFNLDIVAGCPADRTDYVFVNHTHCPPT